LPLAPLEALAAGVPVLVPVESRWPDDLSAVFDFVEMGDPEKLAQEITEGVSRRSSVSLLPRRYSADGMRDEYRELLGGLLRDRAR
jgi:glycosyltransferase involved in cell wall biosynthesis